MLLELTLEKVEVDETPAKSETRPQIRIGTEQRPQYGAGTWQRHHMTIERNPGRTVARHLRVHDRQFSQAVTVRQREIPRNRRAGVVGHYRVRLESEAVDDLPKIRRLSGEREVSGCGPV